MGNEMVEMLAKALKGHLEDEARKHMPPIPQGSDAVPVIPAPLETLPPYSLSASGREARLSLPANKGAQFEAYMNYKLNPFKLNEAGINGAGLRYRWDF